MREFIEYIKKTRFKNDIRYISVRLICSFLCAACAAAVGFIVNNAIVSGVLIAVFMLLMLYMFWEICKRYFLIIKNSEKRFELMEKTNKSIKELGNNTDIETFLNKCLDYFSGAMEREYSAKILQTQAELDSMQSQINPHFLYNTLDSIRGQALEEGSDEIADMIESLSVLFRYTISQRGDILTFEQELKNVDHYIKIQQYRFENRFIIKKVIDDSDGKIYQCRMPKLTLQPIIENAIYHGLETVAHGGLIEIAAYMTESRLVISIKDNGEGMDDEQLKNLNKKFIDNMHYTTKDSPSKRGSGMALVNVNARIKLIFGDDYGLVAYSTKGVGTKIEITLPAVFENPK